MMKISEQRVEDLRRIHPPRTVKDLRKALGAFSYVQRWIPGLAEVAKPLYKLIVNSEPRSRLIWDKEADGAFQDIKKLIANAVALSIPDHSRPFVVVTDCSDTAAGAMLAQRDKESQDLLKPVAFFPSQPHES